jgi:hypothetical protein
MRAALLALLLSGCGAYVESHPRGPTVEPHVRDAPDQIAVWSMEQVFADEAGGIGLAFDPDAPLLVEWHAPDEVFAVVAGSPTMYIIGDTLSGDHVQVTSPAVLMHELVHVALQRNTGDGDGNHAEPPGPWTSEMDAMIERAKHRVE